MSEADASGRERLELNEDWELARDAPGATADVAGLDALSWSPASVPGTVAGNMGPAVPADVVDGSDWWFRVRFGAQPPAEGEQAVLVLEGLATLSEVYLNGERVLESESMFARHEVDVAGRLRAQNELALCFRALAPRLEQRRRPRARWRTRLVPGNLRFFRTMLLGRAPSFSPPTPVVGPWRPVALQRRRGPALEGLRLRARVDGADGVLECRARLPGVAAGAVPESLTVQCWGPDGEEAGGGALSVDPATGEVAGAVRVPGATLWWPHTHGTPVLYEVAIHGGGRPLHRGRVGFRRLSGAEDVVGEGLNLHVNGVAVFARGAVWIPLDLRHPHAPPERLREVLERVAGAGMNMLRLAGIGAYESDAFYDLCDELGILVWQDFMFANLDYPESDPDFMAAIETEGRALLARLGARPSLAALCGGSEVAQQVAMLGLDPELAEGPLYAQLLPALVAEAEVDAPYIHHSPWGGDLPFRTDRGIANYYGVGAYRRPMEDARRAQVKFAGECLAFANLPDEAALDAIDFPGGLSVNHPAWKAGVPRDAGAGWDFEDVRDHYLELLFGVDPVALRWVDQDRYLELSRAVSGEVMAETFGEWRRVGSGCHGALVLWLKDLVPGAGWGVLDHRGLPKVALHHLRRALAPVAVWTTDEGLGGVDIHLANDRPEPLAARLRVSLYSDFARQVGEAGEELELPAHAGMRRNVEAMLGHFVDAAWAYGFGPPQQDLIVVSLEHPGEEEPISQAFRFPAGRPDRVLSASDLGLTAVLDPGSGGHPTVRVSAARFAYGVRLLVPGHTPADDAFGVEPGHTRTVALIPDPQAPPPATGELTALNLQGRVRITAPEG